MLHSSNCQSIETYLEKLFPRKTLKGLYSILFENSEKVFQLFDKNKLQPKINIFKRQ